MSTLSKEIQNKIKEFIEKNQIPNGNGNDFIVEYGLQCPPFCPPDNNLF